MNTNRTTIRRSVLLPASLVHDAMKLMKPRGKLTFNGVVKLALQELIRMQQRAALQLELSDMAADPQIQGEYRRLEEDFVSVDMDGLDG